MNSNSSVSGKKVVFSLFALAAVVFLTVFLVGLKEKHRRQNDPGSLISIPKAAP